MIPRGSACREIAGSRDARKRDSDRRVVAGVTDLECFARGAGGHIFLKVTHNMAAGS